MKKRVNILRIQLTTAIFTLVIMLISGFFIFGPDLVKTAKALSANYGSLTQLNLAQWQNLPNDFLARTGGATSAMQGDLDMGTTHKIINLAAPTIDTDAVTRGAMNTAITSAVAAAGSIKDSLGNNMKMVCGETTAGATNWTQYDPVTVSVIINTNTGLSSPIYFTNLSGTSDHYRSVGTQSVYNPTSNNFTVYVSSLNQNSTDGSPALYHSISVATANANQWHIHWCAVGN
jgi:hypothetical protein